MKILVQSSILFVCLFLFCFVLFCFVFLSLFLFFLDFWHEWVLNFVLAEKESAF